MDLSGLIDLGNLNIDLPDLGTVDLEEMMGSMEIPVSQEGFRQMAASLMEGFNQYGKEHPEADYSGLQSSFEGYLKTDAAKKVMKEAILEIVKKTANVTVSNTQVQKLLSNLKEGFKNSLSNKEPATVDDFYHALESYMSGDGLSVVNSWADDIAKTADVTITDAQMESLSSALVSGYSAYAKEQGFDAVASVLGVSRYKDLAQVNRAAHIAAEKAGLPYLEIEGRKGGMQERRQALIKELNLYNQTYCGCKPRKE